MLSVSEARERILSSVATVGTERVPLDLALGRILAEEVLAPEDLPAFDNSSVDGFALRSGELRAASPQQPATLPVTADIPAGAIPGLVLGPGEAARIMTGAPLPEGADSVVMLEETDFAPGLVGAGAPQQVNVYRPVAAAENVRRRGSDVRSGQVISGRGKRLAPADLGLLAQLGIGQPLVSRRPRVALFSSGNELQPVETSPVSGKIRDANSHMLSALAREAGADIVPLGVAGDEVTAVEALLQRAVSAHADLIVSSAGVSAGAFDFVRAAVEAQGVLEFWRVNMRPGKPLAFGRYGSTPFIGLPGNPVSAYVGFLVFVAPAILAMCGASEPPRRTVRARILQSINSDGRESYLRGIVRSETDGFVAELAGHQGSGNLLALARANALLIIPSGVKSLPPGEEVVAWLL